MPAIFSTLRRGDGSAWIGTVRLRPAKTPLSRTGGLTVEDDITTSTDGSGWFGIHLQAPGDYYVWLGSARVPRLVTIPDSAATYLLEDLLGIPGGSFPVNYLELGTQFLLLNGTTGQFHALGVTGTAPSYQLEILPGGSLARLTSFRWQDAPSKTAFQIWHETAKVWVAPFIASGVLQFGAAGDVVANNARISGAKFQMRDTVAGTWHTVYLVGTSPQFYIGPAV
jgi:hypothetical protein